MHIQNQRQGKELYLASLLSAGILLHSGLYQHANTAQSTASCQPKYNAATALPPPLLFGETRPSAQTAGSKSMLHICKEQSQSCSKATFSSLPACLSEKQPPSMQNTGEIQKQFSVELKEPLMLEKSGENPYMHFKGIFLFLITALMPSSPSASYFSLLRVAICFIVSHFEQECREHWER